MLIGSVVYARLRPIHSRKNIRTIRNEKCRHKKRNILYIIKYIQIYVTIYYSSLHTLMRVITFHFLHLLP